MIKERHRRKWQVLFEDHVHVPIYWLQFDVEVDHIRSHAVAIVLHLQIIGKRYRVEVGNLIGQINDCHIVGIKLKTQLIGLLLIGLGVGYGQIVALSRQESRGSTAGYQVRFAVIENSSFHGQHHGLATVYSIKVNRLYNIGRRLPCGHTSLVKPHFEISRTG